jgi:hypothetical protein
MIAKCPMCSREHDSEATDIDWYFLCCLYRIVWRDDPLRLEVVPEDFDEE